MKKLIAEGAEVAEVRRGKEKAGLHPDFLCDLPDVALADLRPTVPRVILHGTSSCKKRTAV
jgi:hypothetical protein